MTKKIFHLLPNAHLDPVWFWNRREGLNEGIKTCRTVIGLMDKYPDLTFNRGEASIYNHLEKYAPDVFARILEFIREGRWCVTGCNWVQSDQNMPGTSDFIRQYDVGRRYFLDRFGFQPEVAWAADPFGHSAGMPTLLKQAGMRYFCSNRPEPEIMALPDELFYWTNDSGDTVLAARLSPGWYGCERAEMFSRLEAALAKYADSPRQNHPIGIGLGDHGGGPTERHLEEIRQWAEKHPEVEVRFSTFDRFFAAAEQEIAGGFTPPTVSGELNFRLRGCYASMSGFKHLYRQTMTDLHCAEAVSSLVADALQTAAPDFTAAEQDAVFNTFHDILPCSAVASALDEQSAQLQSIRNFSYEAETAALDSLIAKIDIPRVPGDSSDKPDAVPVFLFNPSPYPFRGQVELEAALDYRPLYDFKPTDRIVELRDDKGEAQPYQEIRTEHITMPNTVWRKRVIAEVSLPAFGWKVYSMGAKARPEVPDISMSCQAVCLDDFTMTNGLVSFQAQPGETDMQFILADGRRLPLSIARYEDRFGSWGGMFEEPESYNLQKLMEVWQISRVEIMERGPLRSRMFVELRGRNSRAELIVSLEQGASHLAIELRLIRDDRSSRIKLRMPQGANVCYEVPGGEVTRGTTGQVPGLRYAVIRDSSGGDYAFSADGGYSFDNQNGFFTYSLDKSSRYSTDVPVTSAEDLPSPVERGELRLNLLLTATPAEIRQLVEHRDRHPVALLAWPHKGTMPMTGSFLSISNPLVELLTVDVVPEGLRLRLQNCGAEAVKAEVTVGERHQSPVLQPWCIADCLI